MDILQLPSPITPLHGQPGISVYVKRDDQIHPVVQGNKWRKVSKLFEKLQQEQRPGIITFGGAFSNYLHAVAFTGPLLGLQTVGIVRGEAVDNDNPTLREARHFGMQIFPVAKKEYELKEKSEVISAIIRQFPEYVLVPEGGATREGVLGCAQIVPEIENQLGITAEHLIIAVPAGTGCTAAGIIAGMQGKGHVLVFPAAQYGVSSETISQMLRDANLPAYHNFTFFSGYIKGKFAQPSAEILDYAKQFEQKHGVLPDPIYTSRMFFGINDLMSRNYFAEGTHLVAIHTGGLQAWRGF